ncbi:uncharacterized protein ACA1_106360, partial [Acanthamoeba castellanii str. Neff]
MCENARNTTRPPHDHHHTTKAQARGSAADLGRWSGIAGAAADGQAHTRGLPHPPGAQVVAHESAPRVVHYPLPHLRMAVMRWYGLRGLLGVVDESTHDGLGRQSALRVGGRAGEAAGEERQGDGGVPRVEQAVALHLGPRAVMRAMGEERVVGLPVRRGDVVAQ